MKTVIALIFIFTGLSSFAKTTIHEGSYEVPRDDGKIVDFPSTVEFEGDSLAEAKEFTVTFPKQLVGVENKFVIKKVGDHWEGDSDLFDEVDCSSSDLVYDFSCRLDFNKEKVVDITEKEDTSIQTLIPTLPTPQAFTADFTSSDPTSLFVDKNLAIENMQMASLSASAIGVRKDSIDIFLSEPIGFFKYRAVSY